MYKLKVYLISVDANLEPTQKTHSTVQRAEARVAAPPLRPVSRSGQTGRRRQNGDEPTNASQKDRSGQAHAGLF